VPARSRSPTLVPAHVRARACGVWRPSFRALTKASGAPLALEPRPRRAIASPLRLRIARGGDAGAGTELQGPARALLGHRSDFEQVWTGPDFGRLVLRKVSLPASERAKLIAFLTVFGRFLF
jgi:hypothetical protein